MWQIRTRRLQTHFTPEQTEASCSDSQAQGTSVSTLNTSCDWLQPPQARPEMSPEPNCQICSTQAPGQPSARAGHRSEVQMGRTAEHPQPPGWPNFPMHMVPNAGRASQITGSSVGARCKMSILCISKSCSGQKRLYNFPKRPVGLPTKFKASKAHSEWSSLIKILQDIWKC